MSATQSSKVRWKRRRRRRQPSGKASPGVSFFCLRRSEGQGGGDGKGGEATPSSITGTLYPLPRLAGPVLGGAFSDQCAPSGSEASDSSESQTSEGSVTTSKAIATERAPRRVQVMSPSKRHTRRASDHIVWPASCVTGPRTDRARACASRVSPQPLFSLLLEYRYWYTLTL